MLGHLIYNYQHLDDVRIQQELSKKLYAPLFDGVHLVHAYNGKGEFGYQPYLEDQLLTTTNRGHFRGAVDLINLGLNYFTEQRIPGVRYVLVTAADTWLLNTEFLTQLMSEMERDGKVLAASSWGRAKAPENPSGLSTDFFIIDLEWNREAKIFPLDYDAFYTKYMDMYALLWAMPIVETAVQFNYQKYFLTHYVDNEIRTKRDQMLRRIVEREPVHLPTGERKGDWPEIGLYTSADPRSKQKTLQELHLDLGEYSRKLIQAEDLSYYNRV